MNPKQILSSMDLHIPLKRDVTELFFKKEKEF
jgi:hypothetical protein